MGENIKELLNEEIAAEIQAISSLDSGTVGILYAIVPEGYKVEINRFFKEENNKFVEITEVEYNMRKHCCGCFGASNNDCQRRDVVEDDKENESK